jgi:hypothetical protein
MDNPMLLNVNTDDPEECDACQDAGNWPCAFHEGFAHGVAFMAVVVREAVNDPERVHVTRAEARG